MVIDVVIFIVIVTLTMAILTTIFGGWLVVSLVRGASRLLTGGGPPPRSLPADQQDRRCPHRGCQTSNPPEARFCRRCGTPLVATRSSSSSARRAACW